MKRQASNAWPSLKDGRRATPTWFCAKHSSNQHPCWLRALPPPRASRTASFHRNLEGRLYRGSSAEKGFQLSLITPFEIGVWFIPYSCEFDFLRIAFGLDVVRSAVRKTTITCNFQRSLRGLLQNSHSNGATLITIWRKVIVSPSRRPRIAEYGALAILNFRLSVCGWSPPKKSKGSGATKPSSREDHRKCGPKNWSRLHVGFLFHLALRV